MDKIQNSFNRAKRSNFVPTLLFLISTYLLCYSVLNNSMVAIVICSLLILVTLYLILSNIRYNIYLNKMCFKVGNDLDYVLSEMKDLLSKVESNESKQLFTKIKKLKKITERNDLQKSFEKRKRILEIIFNLNLYKENNIK